MFANLPQYRKQAVRSKTNWYVVTPFLFAGGIILVYGLIALLG